MRALTIPVLVLVTALVGGSGTPEVTAKGERPNARPTRELMEQKLAQAQSALAGIAREDFPSVGRAARKLRAISQQAAWPAFENPAYVRHVGVYEHACDALAQAADEHNLDGVTLAYVKVTMSCVECHKFVRGKKTAELAPAAIPSLPVNSSKSRAGTGGGT